MLKIAIQTQDETLIAHQLAKFDLSELTNLVQTDRVRALAHIDAMLLQGDDSVFDKLIEWANEREISPSKFPRDKDALKALKELNLSNCDLKTLPQELVCLQRLEELVLGYNNFKEFPNALCGLINLKSLNLANCGLKTLPDTLEVLQKLEKLYLPLNQLVCDKWLDSRDLPQVIFKLRNLQELDLCDCNIPSCSTLPKEFINLQNLKKLFINSADFWSDSSVVVSSSQFPSDTTVLSNLKIQIESRGEQLEIHTSTKFKFFW